MRGETEARHSGKRRRRVRRTHSHKETAPTYLKSRAFGRQVFGAMVACTMLYGAFIFYQVSTLGHVIAGVTLGMTRQDVRYRLGPPVSTARASSDWYYAAGETRLHLVFGNDQRLSEAICAEGKVADQPCANVLGAMVNSNDAMLKLRLGPPDQQWYAAGDEFVAYQRLGAVFRLRQSRVVTIDQRGPETLSGRLLETLWIMLP